MDSFWPEDEEMDDVIKREDIVLNIQPYKAVAVIGLLKANLPAIVDHIRKRGEMAGIPLRESFIDDARSILGEIYDKCIVHTDFRESKNIYAELYEQTADKMPSGEAN
ncbi:MAG: hypothetical protein LBU98_06500 [Alistipes sp.]|jgi:hypothetical protein|nr:hypothetical protein [Alistipes sp.]